MADDGTGGPPAGPPSAPWSPSLARAAGRDPRAAGLRRARVRAADLRAAGAGHASPSASPATPCPPATWRCRSPTSSAPSPTCSATGRRCGSGGAGRPTTGSTSSPPAGETGTHTGRRRHLDLGVRDGDGHPHRREPARRCPRRRTCCRARSAAGCCPRRPTGSSSRHRRPAGGRPRRPRPAPDARPPTAASVRRVDVWVDADTGLPLQVRGVREGRRDRPALDTRFLDLDLAVPAAAVTAFTPPPGAAVREGREAEVVLEAGRRIRPVPLPDELAGLPRRRLDGVPAGHRALRQRRHPAGRRPGAAAAWPAGCGNALSAEPGRRRRRAGHAGGRRAGRR